MSIKSFNPNKASDYFSSFLCMTFIHISSIFDYVSMSIYFISFSNTYFCKTNFFYKVNYDNACIHICYKFKDFSSFLKELGNFGESLSNFFLKIFVYSTDIIWKILNFTLKSRFG